MSPLFGRGELKSSLSPGGSTGGIDGGNNSNDSIVLIDVRGGGSSCDAIILDVSLVLPGGVYSVVISWGFDMWR